jgi:hypothetical protein
VLATGREERAGMLCADMGGASTNIGPRCEAARPSGVAMQDAPSMRRRAEDRRMRGGVEPQRGLVRQIWLI